MSTINYKGVDHDFPDDWGQDQVRTALMKWDVMHPSTNLPAPNPIPETTKRDAQNLLAKQFVGSTIPAASATIGSIIGGPAGGAAGAMGGSAIKQMLQNKAPEFFGQAPTDTGSTISDIGKDTLTQGVIPGIISKLPGLVGYLASKVKSDNPAVKQFITNKLTGTMTPTSENLENPASIPSTPSGVTQEQLALNQAIKSGFKNPSSVDLGAIEKELAGKNNDFYEKALSPETQENLINFLKKAKELEPEPKSGGIDGLIRYAKHRILFDIPLALLGGHEAGGLATGAATFGTIQLGRAAFSKLMASDTMGKLAIQALETGKTSEQAGIISQALLHGMRGLDFDLTTPEGTKEKVQVSQNGQIQLKPSQ